METVESQDLSLTNVEGKDNPHNELCSALLNLSPSPGCSPPVCGSAVSALQSKVRAVSQRKLKGKERDDLLTEVCTEQSVKNKQDNEGPPQTENFDKTKSSTGDDEVKCVMEGPRETSPWLCAGSSLENISVSGASEFQLDAPPTKSASSSPRHWAPPKGFWKVARPETLSLNSDISLTLVAPKDVPPKNEKDSKHKPKLRVVDAVVHKELQRSDSLESTFHRFLQKETGMTDPNGGLWKADSWETVCSRGGAVGLADKLEMNKRYLNQYQARASEITTLMRPEGQYKPPTVPNQGDWDSAIIMKEHVFNYKSLFANTDITLSPRHEQAKRLLERARFKARSQNPKSEKSNCTAQKEGLEPLPTSPTVHNAVLVTAQEQVASPLQQQDVRGRNREQGVRMRRCGQSPTRVRFEDESEKEAERRYLERVRQRGPVLVEKSQSTPQLTPESEERGSAINWVNVGIPVAILTKEGECLAAMVSKEEILRTCEACGSILRPAQTNDFPSESSKDSKKSPKWVSAQETHVSPSIVEGVSLTKGQSLDETVGKEGVCSAGERLSAFGKLRRRSRKGESRVETGLGPYARSQDLWAQRRNSKTRSSLEEQTTRSKVLMMPTQVVSEGTSTDSPQLPIKSALKSASKCKQTGQRVVKLMPSVQYRLIHLDHQENIQANEHLSVTLSAPPQVLPVTSGLNTCSRPSSLRYSTAMLTSDLQALTIWDTAEDKVTGASGYLASDGVYMDPRGVSTTPVLQECRPALRAISKSDLRAELLRSEHRKSEKQCDDSMTGYRRAGEREARPKLSLRRFFSAMGLNSVGKLVKGSRSSSMEHLCFPTGRYSSASPSPTHGCLVPLKRTPSLQSLHTQSPLAQLRKVSSVQSLQSPKRKSQRSTVLGELPLELSWASRELQKGEVLEDSQETGPLGRLVQAFPDGTLLIELIRPANTPFGFVISRGKGRPDTGVYVERVGDSPTENTYIGLLGVGDEILEVNGDIIAGLTLDQVTRLMTRESKAKILIRPNSQNFRAFVNRTKDEFVTY